MFALCCRCLSLSRLVPPCESTTVQSLESLREKHNTCSISMPNELQGVCHGAAAARAIKNEVSEILKRGSTRVAREQGKDANVE